MKNIVAKLLVTTGALVTLTTVVSAAEIDTLLNKLVDNQVLSSADAADVRAGIKQQTTVTPSSKHLKDLKIRGRIQTQFAAVQAENDKKSDDWTTFEMRRVRLGMEGTLLENVRARIEANFLPDGFSMRSAYLQWREHKPAYVKVGYDKPTFGYEENTSSASIITVERSMITQIVAPGPLTGLTVDGTQDMFFYSVGAYNNQTNRNNDTESRYVYGLSAGVKVKDMFFEDEKLTARVDVMQNNDETGIFAFEEGLSFSTHYDLNPLEIRLEYITVDNFAGKGTSGWYLTPSYYVNDQFQVVARIEQATSDVANGIRAASRYARRADIGSSGDQRGKDYMALYLGGNYYFAGDAHKLMVGLELSELETQTAGDLTATTVYGAWRMLF